MNVLLSRLRFSARRILQEKPGMLRTSLGIILCGLSLCAMAEDKEKDKNGLQFRLTMGIAPGITSLTTTNSTNADGSLNFFNDGDDQLSPNFGFAFEPGFVYSFSEGKSWGFQVGTNFFYRSVQGEANYTSGNHVKVTLNSAGVDVSGGVYWQLNHWWRVETTPVFGYGRGKTTINVSSPIGYSEDSTESSPYVDYGFRVGAYYTLPSYLLLGLHVGYQAFSTSSARLSQANGSTEEDKVSGSGMTAALSFVLVF